MADIFTEYDPHGVVLLLALAMLVAWGVAWRLGSRLRDLPGPGTGSKFDDASLALLSLLLAFSFGMSLNRHDRRRDMVVADANSIGDFYTCASMLQEPLRSKLIQVIGEYVQLRVKVADSSHPESELRMALPRFQTMQIEMAELVSQAMKKEPPTLGTLLLSSLNRVQSSHAARLAAAKDRLPLEIIVLLFVSAIVSTMLVGREQGSAGRVELGGTIGFITVVVLTVSVILDLNQPTRGLILVNQEPIRELLATIPK
jgi:hypothetical protein